MNDGVLREQLAVLGSPIAHSKSPAIHQAAYAELGVDWRYQRHELQAADLEGFLGSRDGSWRGFSLTMPLKEEAHRLATILDPVAEESGVVNTLLRIAETATGGARWAGFNTDVPGLAAAIAKAGLEATHTVVIGSGATAVSAILAARSLGAETVDVIARNPSSLADIVARFSATDPTCAVTGTPLAHADTLPAEWEAAGAPPTLVISTLPGPAARGLELPQPFTRIPLFDVAYDPWPSPLAVHWSEAGGEVRPGVDMLVEQALLQVRIFFGGDPTIPLPREERVLSAMRAAAA